MKTKVLSVGGSMIIPQAGFDPVFLKNFRKMILAEVKKGTRFVIVIGGGATARNYQDAAKLTLKSLSNDELDWIGIYATMLNARFVHKLFGDLVYKEVLQDPRTKVKTSKPIIIASGWKPGFSTDYDAVVLAQNFGANEVFNLSNISFVYDKDPNKYKSAKKMEEISWKEYRTIIGDKWTPGFSSPFDPIASKKAEKLKLQVNVLNGNNLAEVKKALQGKKFEGSIIM